jgi:hypothetical protein
MMDVWANSDEFLVFKILDPGHRSDSSAFFTLKSGGTL